MLVSQLGHANMHNMIIFQAIVALLVSCRTLENVKMVASPTKVTLLTCVKCNKSLHLSLLLLTALGISWHVLRILPEGV